MTASPSYAIRNLMNLSTRRKAPPSASPGGLPPHDATRADCNCYALVQLDPKVAMSSPNEPCGVNAFV